MKRLMFAALAAAGLALAPAAIAQGGPGTGPGMGYGMSGPGMGMGGMGMMGQRGGRLILDPANLPALKEKLAITTAQEPQWKAYADAVSRLWDTRESMRSQMAQNPPATAADRQKLRDSHHAMATQVHGDVQNARADLSKVLTPEQRTQLDQLAPAGFGPMGPPR